MNLGPFVLTPLVKTLAKVGLLSTFILCAVSEQVGAAENPDGITISSYERTSDGKFRFSFEAKAGLNYPIEVSVDSVYWNLLTNVAGTDGTILVQDDEATNLQRRFYHVGVHPEPTPIADMVFLPAGTFTMGSPAAETGRGTNEGPQTIVTLPNGFWIGKFEVTRADYVAVTGDFSAFTFYAAELPVDFASWINATNYCQKLTDKERMAGRLPPGYIYRLPTEAEWEYACRAGTTTAVGLGDGTKLSSTQANFDGAFPYGGAAAGPYRMTTTPGRTYPANPWGLHDMHGNVWEWVQDIYAGYPGGSVINPKGGNAGTGRILRGGAYNSVGSFCRSAKRDTRSATYRNFGQGFRVVLGREF